MNKLFALIVFIILGHFSFGQNVYFTRNGHIYFISETDAIDIDANNNQVASFLDITSGKLQFAVLIKSFEFKLATAKEHFNESYMESEKYPKATFKGEIIDIGNINLKNKGTYPVIVKGELTLRGITKIIEVSGEITVTDGEINAKSEFNIPISDYNISVPSLVEHRVAKQIIVKVDMIYLPYNK